MYRILLIDDDNDLLDANEIFFTQKGYQVFRADNATDGLHMMETITLDCVILDIDMPGQNGFQLCSRARRSISVPIIFLSAYGEEENRVRGFTIGADDFVCKPFSLRELELRVQARIHRRYEDRPAQILEFGGLSIDSGKRRVSYQGTSGDFSRIEFDILLFLAQHPEQVFSYEQIYDGIWRAPINEGRHTLQARMAETRQKLARLCPDHRYIRTVRGKGYCFFPDPSCSDPSSVDV